MAGKYNPASLNDVSGLVAVVTGGGTGLGLILAKALESNGAKVYITGRRKEKLEKAAQQAQHNNLHPIVADVTSKVALQSAVDLITAESGHIDLLICNAGMTSSDQSPNPRPPPSADSPISDIRDYYFNYRSPETWTQVLETNIAAVFTTSMAFLELLDQGNRKRDAAAPTSQIIALGSIGGLNKALPSFVYNASKAGVHHLMKNLGCFLVGHDIRTNVIAPGWFPTDMTVSVQKAWEGQGGVMPRSEVPRRRMGTEEEMAGTVLYLASKAGGYCNGNIMVIDGGYLANHPGTY